MSEPEEIKIQAKNIDAAAGEIIGILEDTSKGNVVFVGGWHGFGASAALKAVAQRLKSSKSKFDKVIHVDCSLWKSMRALQKAIAEELELPPSVMAIFDRWDEEDDFSGIDEGSRGVIADIRSEIFRNLISSRFLVIFHNGSDEYIDLYESCGVPVLSVLSNKVLWTWHGRFRPSFGTTRIWREGGSEVSKQIRYMELSTDVVVNYSDDDCIRDEALLEEAKEVVTYMGIPEPYMNHRIVETCFLYAYALGSLSPPQRRNRGYSWEWSWERKRNWERNWERNRENWERNWESNWVNHASNYLVCDGIIQGQGDTSAWGVADALQRYVHLDWLLDPRESASDDIRRHLQLQCRLRDSWVLVAVHKRDKGLLPDEISVVLSEATSFFVVPGDSLDSPITTLPNGIFQHSHSSKLRVLYLSECRFSFESPPFLCCSQLRFLLLHFCSNLASDKHPIHNEEMSCFQKLWVLHLRSTNWYRLLSEEMMNFMADLRELHVEGVQDWSISDLRGRGPSLVKVHVEVWDYFEKHAPCFPDLSSARFLKTIILDSCLELEQVVPGVLPPSLESFTIKSSSLWHKTSSISFRGCSQLKSILLEGYMGRLEELDLSGTIVKTLDLRKVNTNLKRLILLGCEKLCAILWPPEDHRTMVLHINTVPSTSPGQANWEEKPRDPIAAMGSSSILAATAAEQGINRYESFDFKWYICTRDTRILRSLEPVKRYIEHRHVYIEMDSSPTSGATIGDSEVAQGFWSLFQPDNYSYARDVFFRSNLHASTDNEGAISWIWDCPASPTPRAQDVYLHIQDKQEMKRGLLQQQQSNIEGINAGAALPPSFIVNNARMLHVHDSSSITCITCPQPQGSCWRWLEWCRVERCPKLRTVFYTPEPSKGDSFCYELATFWASDLPKACYICDWSAIRMFSFVHIVLLHLDHCPRLIHALPLSDSVDTLPHLDTLEIVCCGDLREVFALDPKQKRQRIIECPKLRRIHLYELPSLQHICGSRMSAPNLETVKIRGCWSLRSLPAVSRNNEKMPSVDCEKDWWDNLEWDGVEANHHSSLYEHNHSAYYKAQQQRGTVLR